MYYAINYYFQSPELETEIAKSFQEFQKSLKKLAFLEATEGGIYIKNILEVNEGVTRDLHYANLIMMDEEIRAAVRIITGNMRESEQEEVIRDWKKDF